MRTRGSGLRMAWWVVITAGAVNGAEPEGKRPGVGQDTVGHPAHAAHSSRRRPLFVDTRFQRGFLLSHSDSKRGRQVEATLDLGESGNRPVWRMCQWATKYSLGGVRVSRHSGGDRSYENKGKKVVVGGADSVNRDLILAVNGRAEYGDRPRRAGENWVHLLVEQDAREIIVLSRLASVELRLKSRLLHFEDHLGSRADPGLHAAQYQLFLVVKNVNEASSDRREYMWFGVPLFDNRHAIPPAYMAKDGGKRDATGKFIYTIDGRGVLDRPLRSGEWQAMKIDLLPHIRAGLAEAVRRKYFSSADPTEFAVVNMNMGWEVPGTYDVSMQIRDFDLTMVLAER